MIRLFPVQCRRNASLLTPGTCLLLCLLALFAVSGCGSNDNALFGLPPVSFDGSSGDPHNYYPWSTGNTWISRGTVAGSGTADFYTLSRITGHKTVNGVQTTVWAKIRIKKTSSGSVSSDRKIDSYLVKSGSAITYWGNDDARDTLTPGLIPYRNAVFPLVSGTSFVQLDKQNMAIEGGSLDVHSVVTLQSMNELVSLPLGTFSNCLAVDTAMTLMSAATTTATQVMWHAPGVGVVKSTTETIVNGSSETISEELVGYVVDDMRTGLTPSTLSMTVSGATGTGTVDRDGIRFYLVAVAPDRPFSVGLSGMSAADSANLHVFNGPNKCSNTSGLEAKSCGITGPEAVLYIAVDGFSLSGEAAAFTLTVQQQPAI